MRFFQKRKVKSASPTGEKAATWIAGRIQKLQNAWAYRMGKYYNRVPVVLRKPLWVGFCLCLFAYSTSLIAGSFNTSVVRISLPKAIDAPIKLHPAMGLPKGYVRHQKELVERIRYQLDSLQSLPDGKKKLDSLLQKRPGLLDSLKKIEQVYYTQQ